jgi:cytochrome P450
VKAVLTDPTGTFDKAGSGGGNPLARQLFGEGLVGLTGEKWARHRRVIAPAFNMERIKVKRRFLENDLRNMKMDDYRACRSCWVLPALKTNDLKLL